MLRFKLLRCVAFFCVTLLLTACEPPEWHLYEKSLSSQEQLVQIPLRSLAGEYQMQTPFCQNANVCLKQRLSILQNGGLQLAYDNNRYLKLDDLQSKGESFHALYRYKDGNGKERFFLETRVKLRWFSFASTA